MATSRAAEFTEIPVGFTFGNNLCLESDGTLLRGHSPIHLTPKELAALRLLLDHAGRIVTPAEIKQALWPDVYVTPDSIPRCISSLRARLGPDADIRTIYKRGYRLDGTVRQHVPTAIDKLPRLAILPFRGSFGTPDHLAPSLADDLCARLTSIRPVFLRILARESAFTLASTGLTEVEIGRRIGADYVLGGTLQAFAESLRLRVEMITIPEGHQIWVEDILVPRGRPADLEQHVVERLAYRLGGGLSVSAASEEDAAPGQPSAFETFLLGRHEGRSQDRHRMLNGIELLQRAGEIDNNLLPAREELARISVNACLLGYEPPVRVAAQVRAAAGGSFHVADLPHTFFPCLAWVAFHFERDLPLAQHLFELSEEAQADSWFARLRVLFALSRHRFDEAFQFLQTALRIDPFAPCLHAELAWAHYLAGHVRDSVEYARRNLSQFRSHDIVDLSSAVILACHDNARQAADIARAVNHRRPQYDIALSIQSYALARLGEGAEAFEILERLQWSGHERYVCTSFTPAAYLALGDPGTAIAELQNAERNRCPWFFQILADPRLAPLHGSPEFERMRSLLPQLEAASPPDRLILHSR